MTAPRNQPLPPEMIERLRAYHEKHIVWGSLHIVMDDFNVDDDHVRWCIAQAQREGDIEGAELGRALLTQSRSQRLKLARRL